MNKLDEQNSISDINKLFSVFSHARSLKKEKAFARLQIISKLNEYGYNAEEIVNKDNRIIYKLISGKFGRNNVNVVANCENPRYLITAHYDTVNTINSKMFSYLTRKMNARFNQIVVFLIQIFILLMVFLFSIFLDKLLFGKTNIMTAILIYLIITILIVKTNWISTKFVADDNTSGIVAALILSKLLKEHNDVQFAFFDNEEKGMCGSYSYLKSNKIANNTKIINLDTIGRGRVIGLCYEKRNDFVDEFEKNLIDKKWNYILREKSFSDDKFFCINGYNALSLTRGDLFGFKQKKALDVSWTHTNDDILDNIDINRLFEVIEIVYEYILKDLDKTL